MSLFSAVEMAPRDPILGLNEQFAADTNPAKVNLDRLQTHNNTRSNNGFNHHKTNIAYSGHGHNSRMIVPPASQ